MKFIVLGSGGSLSIPRPFCNCNTCKNAREIGIHWARTGPALFLRDIFALFDTPEEIRLQIEREKIERIEHVFYTHWHPDHTHGMRIFEHINFSYPEEKITKKPITVYIPEDTIPDFKKYYPFLFYYEQQKFIEIKTMQDRLAVVFEKISITPINFKRKDRVRYGYLIENKKTNKRVMYAPCSVYEVEIDEFWENLDILFIESGWFGNTEEIRKRLPKKHNWQDHISFEENIEIIKQIKPKMTILTHIDGTKHLLPETNINFLRKQEEKYKEFCIRFAHDGMQIEV